MLSDLRTYISLSEAARRYDLDPDILTTMIEDGRLDAVKTDGSIAVAEDDTKNLAQRRNFKHLDGNQISMSEASRKYDVPHSTLRGWVNKGYIEVLSAKRQQGRPIFLNERDVAYRAAFYHRIKEAEDGDVSGKHIFSR